MDKVISELKKVEHEIDLIKACQGSGQVSSLCRRQGDSDGKISMQRLVWSLVLNRKRRTETQVIITYSQLLNDIKTNLLSSIIPASTPEPPGFTVADKFSMAATKAAKQLLRKEIKQRLAALSDSEKLRQSQIVFQKLISSKRYNESRRISVFLSMPDEIHTENILKHMFENNKICYIPRYTKTSMDMVRIHSMEEYNSLPETAWKIKQPPVDEDREDAMKTGGLDMILMPGLGFTREGTRIGRGKGYYDTYIQEYTVKFGSRPYLLALTYKEQLCTDIPTSQYDIPVDEVLYDDQ